MRQQKSMRVHMQTTTTTRGTGSPVCALTSSSGGLSKRMWWRGALGRVTVTWSFIFAFVFHVLVDRLATGIVTGEEAPCSPGGERRGRGWQQQHNRPRTRDAWRKRR